MIDEICRPWAPSPATNRSETSSATTLGTNVTNSATGDRSTISSSTRMSTMEYSVILRIALFALLLLAAFVATWPAR